MNQHLRTPLLALVGLLFLAGPVAAQDHADHHGDHGLPDGWNAHFDGGHGAHGADDLEFVSLDPGWLIMTGPSGIFYRHMDRAEGDFTVRSLIHLFDPGERRESYGIFIGGSALHGDEARYTYFLVRRTGEYMIRHRVGGDLHDVQGWTAHDAVLAWDDRPDGDDTAANQLEITVSGDQVHFLVNGREVHRAPRADLDVEGHYGLRVNHNLDLHVESLELVSGG